jgi:hypothetical protein
MKIQFTGQPYNQIFYTFSTQNFCIMVVEVGTVVSFMSKRKDNCFLNV